METLAAIAIFVVATSATTALAGQSEVPLDRSRAFASEKTSTLTAQEAGSRLARSAMGDVSVEPCELRPEGFWGKVWTKINPSGGKKRVQCELLIMRRRLSELDELTAQNSKMIRDVDARAQTGIQLASAKADEANQHAIDADNRAQTAEQTAAQATSRLNTVEQAVANIDDYQPTVQTEIQFHQRDINLSNEAKSALDEIATPLKEQRGYVVEVQGFSSGSGEMAMQQSELIAGSVTRYLVLDRGIPAHRVYELGFGSDPDLRPHGDLKRERRGGRVRVSVLKSSLERLAEGVGPDHGSGIPAFPWPPPAASARELIPNNFLATGKSPVYFGDVDQKLIKALEENGYFERSYFEAPNGFVLVTRLEQIEPDGRSKTLPARWSADLPRCARFSLGCILSAIFTAPVGYYRIIAFVVGSSSPEGEAEVTQGKATSWLRSGASLLPESIALLPYKPAMTCTALIYEFEREEQIKDPRFLSPSHLDARTHLVKSGLWRALGDKKSNP